MCQSSKNIFITGSNSRKFFLVLLYMMMMMAAHSPNVDGHQMGCGGWDDTSQPLKTQCYPPRQLLIVYTHAYTLCSYFFFNIYYLILVWWSIQLFQLKYVLNMRYHEKVTKRKEHPTDTVASINRLLAWVTNVYAYECFICDVTCFFNGFLWLWFINLHQC